MSANSFNKVLAIETSCDDTSVAIVGSDGWVYQVASLSQDKDHAVFGGIVPEIASRSHNTSLLPLVEICLQKANLKIEDLDGICVTSEPGLLGSLLVGLVTAKTLAMTFDKPFLGVNHLEGHLLAPFLKDDKYQPPTDFDYPFLALAVSGGHTSLYVVHDLGKYEILGTTLDDAAGEAFDKFAKLAGLPYPGGPHVDQKAKNGDPSRYEFPRALLGKGNLSFSFSGVKASASRMLQSMSGSEIQDNINDLCASYQEAIVDALLQKVEWALKIHFTKKKRTPRLVITGGVSANSRLRDKAESLCKEKNIALVIPPIRYCTDNAAMIGYAGIQHFQRGERDDLSLSASSSSVKFQHV
ncbi:MAG: tRNA (adenosine(37)-N6)-threonylcarbamoyltransferase complex transferase subunit TsaD [Bdellovibrionales bacterium]|nr:tRNA (adenosine(37)-N6)-threonylcarbamoyltransferase complex transferase subunit TsaD [Bdellovibrionales bacterium]